MKNYLFLFLTMFCFTFYCNAQIEFQEEVLDVFAEASADGSLDVTDVDNDGDFDIIIASYGTDVVKLLKNITGDAGGFLVSSISVGDGPSSVYATDIDNDGDKDVVISYDFGNKILWQKNVDGNGTFVLGEIITTNVPNAKSIYAADIDNDGDMDILSASSSFVTSDYRIAWYENTDGNGAFGDQQIITTSLVTPRSVYAADIDNDGDMDVIASAGGGGGKVIWYENVDGQGDFSVLHSVATNHVGVANAIAVDMDSDGDLDIIADSGAGEAKLIWYENLDGQGNFGNETIIAAGLGGSAFDIADIDGDGDNDVITPKYWYENLDGQGNFGIPQLIGSNVVTNANVIKAVDFDGDNDIDIVYPKTYSGGFAYTSWYENLGSNRNEITGNIGFDINNNNCNLGNPLSNLLISANNGTDTFSTFTLSSGVYQLFVDESIYTTQIEQLPNYFTSTPISQITDFVGLGNTETIDFCLEPLTSINDINIIVYPSINDPRPGFNTTYQLVYNNIGTTQLSGSVSFEYDNSKLNFLNASEIISAQTTNMLTFDFSDLNPFETRTIDLEFNVSAPPITNIDDILVATATVNPVTGDETEEDNVFTLEQTVIGSYDPNDITVLEGDQITIEEADNYLHYLIRFQNTGTASAINVRVEHILDDKLDWTTMQLQSLSHTGRVEITDETDVSFIFNNINLADSTTDEPNSHGYIAFKIKPKSDVEVGDIINGTADIFFDFNPPITTNTVNTEIVAPLSVAEFNAQSIQLYPNPAKDQLKITSHKIMDKLTIVDINGRVLNDIQLSNSESTLDVSTLTKGVYFLEIQSGASKSTKKFIKN